MIDFNQAEAGQYSGGAGAIPPLSCVAVTVSIKQPMADKQGSHPLLSISGKGNGNEYLAMTFEVCAGVYAGRKILENFTVSGSETATKISMRTLRAVIESARGINPEDSSPQASQARVLSDWSDFNNIMCYVMVDAICEKEYNGSEYYINNHIKKIITPDMPEYATLCQVGEIITDNPLPEKPTTPITPAATTGGWGAQSPAQTAQTQPQAMGFQPQTQTQPSTQPIPAWAKK